MELDDEEVEACRLVARDGDLLPAVREVLPEEQRFPLGAQLVLRLGRIEAHAVVQPWGIELQPGSTVYIDCEKRFGRELQGDIKSWIASRAVRPIDDEIGRVEEPISGYSPAGMVKRASCGRTHNANALHVVEAPGFPGTVRP